MFQVYLYYDNELRLVCVDRCEEKYLLMTEYNVPDIWDLRAVFAKCIDFDSEQERIRLMGHLIEGKEEFVEGLLPIKKIPEWLGRLPEVPGITHMLGYEAAACLLNVDPEYVERLVYEYQLATDNNQDDEDYTPYISMAEVQELAKIIYLDI